MTQKAQAFRVRGLVQGVGFRPTVYRIAAALNVAGTVFNDSDGVLVHLEGDEASVDAFPQTLLDEKPPLARIDEIVPQPADWVGYDSFSIDVTPQGGAVTTAITADASICSACLTDIFTPENPRYRYAFTNCTHCGPRFTITKRLPYDRPQTAMAGFPLCERCKKEYDDPLDRRFHAQPVACPVCGPTLTLTDAHANPIEGDPLREAAKAIRAGKILALKGLGGFHLVCDATNEKAVSDLRARKHRDEKPLAVMVAGRGTMESFAHVTDALFETINSPAHPILLLEKKAGAAEWPGIADGLNEIGVMTPYTPLHALLFHALVGEPDGLNWMDEAQEAVLVMTSANFGGEPLVTTNEDAYRQLHTIADVFLVHNRDIVVRCDDSVLRPMDAEGNEPSLFIRRARGWAPEAVRLEADNAPQDLPTVEAFGPYLKNTGALLRGKDAFLTPHIGSLKNQKTTDALAASLTHMRSIFEVTPEVFACDAHPDFPSTHLAAQKAQDETKPLYRIGHHAAHIGAVMAEMATDAPTFGLALDGVGLGGDGGTWGGEALYVMPTGYVRVGHIEPLALPGGDKAAREAWRMGASLCVLAENPQEIVKRFGSQPFAEQMEALIKNPRLTQTSTSLGRWYDGASALLGLTLVQHDEATAAMRLEAAAARGRTKMAEPFADWSEIGLEVDEDGTLRLRELAKKLIDATTGDFDVDVVAATFENTLVRLLGDWMVNRLEALKAAGLPVSGPVAGGGCLVNRALFHGLNRAAKKAGLTLSVPLKAPPGDGGLSLGQAWLAALAHRAGSAEHRYYGTLNDYCLTLER